MLLLILDPPLFSHCFIVSCSCSFRVPNCNTWCESSCPGWAIQEYHIGDEDTNESTMSRLTNLDCFTGGDFEEYAERLQFYFLANDVGKLGSSPSPAENHAADRKKAAVLISLLSGTVYSTLKSLCLPNTPATKGFDELITLLNNYYKPEVSSVTATYLFNQCRQESEESVKDFINRLKRAAVKCDFGSHLDRALRDQFLAGLSDDATRKEILAKPAADIRSFQEVTKIATARETAVKAAAQLASSSIVVSSSSSVNAISRKHRSSGTTVAGAKVGSRTSSPRKCFNCGKEGHIARDANCPAKGHRCSKCQKQNHFEDVCRSSKRKAANFLFNEEYEEEDRDDYLAFNITDTEQNDVASVSGARTDACIGKVQIDGVDCEALIDSGSSVDVLGEDVLRRLRNDGHRNKRLEASQSRLYAYGNTELPVVGKFSSRISFAGKATNTSIVVIAGKGRCLLGRSTARELGLLRTGPEERHVNATDEDADQFAADMRKKFSEVFTGVGCLRDYRLQLHTDDPSVAPVAQKPRRVPFDLIEKDMEEVPGPTTWASPIVVSPKVGGDIRLCVDMRVANTAIQRERLPIPTVDEALDDLNGSAVFTKLDFNFGSHQIELAESSRDVTTFCTQDGLYRYKRLSFGANATPEKFQHIIRQVLADCPGTVNIAEDIVVHGRTTEEHDRRLLKVLERLHKRGLTLNSKKCNFRMPRVKFMGYLLSVHGIGPTAEKSRAVTEAQQPKNAANRLSLLLKPGNTSSPSENEHLFMVATHTVPSAVQARDLKEASAADPVLTDIRQRLKVNNWSDAPKAYKTSTRVHLHRTFHHARHSHRRAVVAEKRSSSDRTRGPFRHGQGEDATTREGLVAQHRQRRGNDLPHMNLLPGCGTAASTATNCPAYAVPVTTVVRTRRRHFWSTPVR